MEPSRQAAARRRRSMLALSRELDQKYGPDQSPIIFTLSDGWTIRRVVRLEDQYREGELLHNCLRDLREPCDNVWSLRDTYNLPHLCFSTWSIAEDDDLDEIPETIGLGNVHAVYLNGARALLQVDSTRGSVKPAHQARLRAFADSHATATAEPFPADDDGRLRVAVNALDAPFKYHVDFGDRIALLP